MPEYAILVLVPESKVSPARVAAAAATIGVSAERNIGVRATEVIISKGSKESAERLREQLLDALGLDKVEFVELQSVYWDRLEVAACP